MTLRFRTPFLLLGFALAIGLAGCSEPMSPASPSSAGMSAGQAGSAQPVGLTGVVAALNVEARRFSLTVRGGSRTVLADADTTIWSQTANSQVRFTTLRDGQVVSIRGLDQGRYVLARSIVINR